MASAAGQSAALQWIILAWAAKIADVFAIIIGFMLSSAGRVRNTVHGIGASATTQDLVSTQERGPDWRAVRSTLHLRVLAHAHHSTGRLLLADFAAAPVNGSDQSRPYRESSWVGKGMRADEMASNTLSAT